MIARVPTLTEASFFFFFLTFWKIQKCLFLLPTFQTQTRSLLVMTHWYSDKYHLGLLIKRWGCSCHVPPRLLSSVSPAWDPKGKSVPYFKGKDSIFLISSLWKQILSKTRSQRTDWAVHLFKGKTEALNHVIFNLKKNKNFFTCYCMFHKQRKQSDQVVVYGTR